MKPGDKVSLKGRQYTVTTIPRDGLSDRGPDDFITCPECACEYLGAHRCKGKPAKLSLEGTEEELQKLLEVLPRFKLEELLAKTVKRVPNAIVIVEALDHRGFTSAKNYKDAVLRRLREKA